MDKLKQRAKIAKTKAKSTVTGVGGWFRRHLAFTIVLAVVILAFIGSLVFVDVYYRGKAAPGVTIADAKVGGQNVDQIVDTINGLVNNMQLSLTYGGKSATASAADLGINIDAEKIANEAIKTGQGNPFSIIFNRTHFDLTGSYDQAKVNAFVTENFPELSTDPKDAQVVYDSNQNIFTVQPGAIGKSVRLDDLYAQVEQLLSSPKLTSYEIATNDDNPTVDDAAAQDIAEVTQRHRHRRRDNADQVDRGQDLDRFSKALEVSDEPAVFKADIMDKECGCESPGEGGIKILRSGAQADQTDQTADQRTCEDGHDKRGKVHITLAHCLFDQIIDGHDDFFGKDLCFFTWDFFQPVGEHQTEHQQQQRNNQQIDYRMILEKLEESISFLPIKFILTNYLETLKQKQYPHLHIMACLSEILKCITEITI